MESADAHSPCESLSTCNTVDSASTAYSTESEKPNVARTRCLPLPHVGDFQLAHEEASEIELPASTHYMTEDNHESSPTSRLPYQGYDEHNDDMHVVGSPLPEDAPAGASPDDGSSPGSEAMDHATNHPVLGVEDPEPDADYAKILRKESDRWAFKWEGFRKSKELDQMDTPAVVATLIDDPMRYLEGTPGLLFAPLEDNAAIDVGPDLPTLAGIPELCGLEDEGGRSLMDEIMLEIDMAMAEWSTNNL
ncbi:uncharacterized protein B0H18DRAFT_1208376 [Fomitopsis serialis]|uniref:uncharacterized protein n=1 Tax=Fomitopsis serialis TaxID=139415 RepID=UPI002008D65D|nr:uncharacterized protein B0H18DRAFT_1208376 [Neoantrodia serialis]KAH9932449.1 hypothetical protein B0H18DRAFT_1208376 [Neoantrodia serialis]